MLLLIICLLVSSTLAQLSRSCDPSRTNQQYTGFRVDRQIILQNDNVQSHETHLILCKDGNRISDLKTVHQSFEDSKIPWNETLCAGSSCFKLSRRKNYIYRPDSVYIPGHFIGGLFEIPLNHIDTESIPKDEDYIPIAQFIAESIQNQWVEMYKNSNLIIYHIPLLYTPDHHVLDHDQSYTAEGNWYTSISANERYEFNDDSKSLLDRSIKVVLIHFKNILKNSTKKFKNLNERITDGKPVRKPMKTINVVSKSNDIFGKIFKTKIDELSKLRFNKNELDFSNLLILSHVYPKKKFDTLLINLNSVFDKLSSMPEQIFIYPKSQN